MQDLQTFYDWMILSARKGKSTACHYKSGLSACSKDFLEWKLADKPLSESKETIIIENYPRTTEYDPFVIKERK